MNPNPNFNPTRKGEEQKELNLCMTFCWNRKSESSVQLQSSNLQYEKIRDYSLEKKLKVTYQRNFKTSYM